MKRELKAKKADLMAKLADMPDSQLKVRRSVQNCLSVRRSYGDDPMLDWVDAEHWHIAVALFALKQRSYLEPQLILILVTYPAHRFNGSLAARYSGTSCGSSRPTTHMRRAAVLSI